MADPKRRSKFPYETVEQVERDGSPPPPAYKRRTAVDKLGVYNIIVLILGTLAILLAVAFLAFLWIVSIKGTVTKLGVTRDDMPPLWKLIATNKWVSRVITLSAILIRTATAAQLCVYAAIMAALILERVGVSARDFPLLSMIRAANSGPQALIWNVLHTLKTGTQIWYSTLIVLTILNAIALQFTSTILLADVSPTYVVLNETTIKDTFYGLSNDSVNGQTTNTYAGVDFWKTGPQVYPRMAETAGKPSNGTNFTDTGKTYRGFLPFTDPTDRNSLRAYDGPMEVIDARVVCVKPTLSNLTIWPYNPDNATATQYVISGTMNIDGVYSSALTTKTDDPSDQQQVLNYFKCTAPQPNFVKGSTFGNASICILGTNYARLLNGIIPEPYDSRLPLGSTMAMLLINGTSVNEEYNNTVSDKTPLQQAASSAPAWAKFGNKDLTFDLSYCFFNPRPQDYKVLAVTLQDWPDTAAFWDNSTGVNVLNTTWVELSLDGITTNDTVEDRGQLTLFPSDYNNTWANSAASRFYKSQATSFILNSLGLEADDGFGVTYQLTPWVVAKEALHRANADLVAKFLRKSDNPALALQALWTVLLSMAYYDFAGLYDVHANATYGISVVVNIPYQFDCFFAVMGLLLLHFILLTIAVVLFLTTTEMSLLGNSWQAVSQVMSTDTANTVHDGAMYTDQEVQDTRNGADGRMVIARSETTGRTEAVSLMRRR